MLHKRTRELSDAGSFLASYTSNQAAVPLFILPHSHICGSSFIRPRSVCDSPSSLSPIPRYSLLYSDFLFATLRSSILQLQPHKHNMPTYLLMQQQTIFLFLKSLSTHTMMLSSYKIIRTIATTTTIMVLLPIIVLSDV